MSAEISIHPKTEVSDIIDLETMRTDALENCLTTLISTFAELCEVVEKLIDKTPEGKS